MEVLLRLTCHSLVSGNAVALSDSLLAVRAPFAMSGTGTVMAYVRSTSVALSIAAALFGEQRISGFGYAVHATYPVFLVGAPFLYAPDTTTPAGGAYFYW